MVRRRVLPFWPCPEHEVATWDSGEKLGEVVADRERPAETAGPLADELVAHLQHGASDVGLVHQRDRPMDQLERRAHLELGVDFAQSGRDLGATLELIRRVRDHYGLDLIDTTTDDQIFSLV